MSFGCIRLVFEQLDAGRVPGGPSVGMVLLKLADRANDDGVCWPGLESLGRDVGLSKRTAERAVSQLVAAGLLKRVARTDGAGRQLTNVYRIPVPSKEGVKLTGGRQIDGGGVKLTGGASN